MDGISLKEEEEDIFNSVMPVAENKRYFK